MMPRSLMIRSLGLALLLAVAVRSETAPAADSPAEPFLYTIAYNSIPGGSSVPLIGFVNLARGTHNGLEFGFVNSATGNFRGVQFGFINTAIKSLDGVQFGFVNTTLSQVNGIQFGFVNTTLSQVNGIQFGLVNTATESLSGVQFGFVNTTLSQVNGVQYGFVNTTLSQVNGIQFGSVNTATESLSGVQFGFFNSVAKEMSGVQFGFVNIADSVAGGLPIGIISIVSKGGYRAVEISADEWHPYNLTGKMGIPRFYTLLRIGTDNPTEWKQSETNYAVGFGSLFYWGNRWSFNPELTSLLPFSSDEEGRQALSLALQLRYHLTSRLWLGGGASLFVVKTEDGETPSFSRYGTLAELKLNDDRRGGIGLRAAVGFDWAPQR